MKMDILKDFYLCVNECSSKRYKFWKIIGYVGVEHTVILVIHVCVIN